MELVEAINRLTEELRINRSPDELLNRARNYEKTGDILSAEQLYKYLARNTDNIDAKFSYAVLLLNQKRFEQAIDILYEINDHMDIPEVHKNIAFAWSRLHSYERSIWHYRICLDLRPNHHSTMSDLSLELLRIGEFQEGKLLFEYRNYFNGEFSDRYVKGRLPLWNGEDLTGKKIFVSKEQGFGDAIQFIRYLPMLAEEAEHVTWMCEPALVKLFQDSFPYATFVDSAETIEPHDYWFYQMSLPIWMGECYRPYLKAEYDDYSKITLPEGLKIGITWKGNARHANDENRSMRLESFDLLPKDANYISLQKLGTSAAEIKRSPLRLIDFGSHLGDFDDTARVISQLDLVIAVDTAIAHLAGALGVPCWIVLPYYGSDWRWGPYGQRTCKLYDSVTQYWMTREKALPDALIEDLGKFIVNQGKMV